MKNRKITKAIIPAAGLGTRFLPATKVLPKEMLPIINIPTIQYIVDEAKQSGIKELLIITNREKEVLEKHFDINSELESILLNRQKNDLLKLIHKTNNMNIYFTHQDYPRGLGDAIYTARSFVGNDPFAVLLGDDITQSKIPLTKQLINSFNHTKTATIAVKQVPSKDVSKYGIIDPSDQVMSHLYKVKSFVEKPSPKTAPSNLAIIGRYVLTPQIFTALNQINSDDSGEIQLTTAINLLNQSQNILAYEFQGNRYDTGNKLNWLETNIEFGLQNPEISRELQNYLRSLETQINVI